MAAAATAVTDQAAAGGSATTTASQRLATSMVPCTHHRRGTDSRSSYSTSSIVGRVVSPPVSERPEPRMTGVTGMTGMPDVAEVPVQLVRLDPDLPVPAYAHPGDAGADLLSTVDVTLRPGERAMVPTG